MKLSPRLRKQDLMVINLSGRGDKDLHIVADILDTQKGK